jgi:hypothetical protein
MIKNILSNNVIYILSKKKNQTSLTFEHFRRSHQTSELPVRGSHILKELFSTSDSGEYPELISSLKEDIKNE